MVSISAPHPPSTPPSLSQADPSYPLSHLYHRVRRDTDTDTNTNTNADPDTNPMKLPIVPSLMLGGLPLGFVPSNYGASSMSQLNTLLGPAAGKAATYGWYAQTYPDQPFNGNQLLWQMNDIVQSGAILEAAVMPVGGWAGLTAQDNSRAVEICNVMKRFTDSGVEVRLRFGHEVNWYVQEGRYEGGADQGVGAYKEAFATVAKACRAAAPKVKMWYSPSWADLATYDRYAPDLQYVDLVGLDFYPDKLANANVEFFISQFKPFHDKYTSGGRIKFAIGETGLHLDANLDAHLAWLQMVCSNEVRRALPNLLSVTYFNVMQTAEQNDYRILQLDGNATTPANAQTLGVLRDAKRRTSLAAPRGLPKGSASDAKRHFTSSSTSKKAKVVA
ncbi:uncharacterized protein PFL1_01779 [Pseudozyma flocculosa PF-1]|uniref:uncharacterized protein n=1 Tax=Pseudozyma flocculosa PF-1 TaxID=1277687 RepID=UPI000456051F|nr:uncharacterized protein PFL1_01779 [Pseudozyma flocculosa PF-1]EPQ30882.1 hypothetical protein PFL1_01779 [Pseudozyma flocculosa PF-1]